MLGIEQLPSITEMKNFKRLNFRLCSKHKIDYSLRISCVFNSINLCKAISIIPSCSSFALETCRRGNVDARERKCQRLIYMVYLRIAIFARPEMMAETIVVTQVRLHSQNSNQAADLSNDNSCAQI